ncbi:fungal-specific transcription factor domain-containing protein [Lophiotrema nucula]|uniref:Fungal-specific transcription factor domain-containing protein n=1 Tax=Lophiotrema nucula TaxID=690887 RepID=A0A6A5ZPB5_9PLEO|nr:fungal-specific transcription factor domain-containing protein [Lophiotrema nucula]
MNSCLACQRGKRKCDRAQPSCSTCVRVGKVCVYAGGEASIALTRDAERSSAARPLPKLLPSKASSTAKALLDPPARFDPFQQIASRQATVHASLAAEAQRLIGPHEAIVRVVDAYFDTIHKQIPIISSHKLRSQVRLIENTETPSEVTALCLCMHLVQQVPTPSAESMTTGLYISVKSLITLIQATECRSLEFIQCMVLVAYYEMGHGVLVATGMTVAACSRLARDIGLHKFQEPTSTMHESQNSEERRRVWWALLILDRYTSFCRGDSFYSTPDMNMSSHIPIEDELWDRNIVPSLPPHLLSTPCSPNTGTFARECQVIHFLGSVIRHVFEPSTDPIFQIEEAHQLENALMAFMPLMPLVLEEQDFDKYGVALSICASALFTLYTQSDQIGVQKKLEDLALGMTHYMQNAWQDLATVQVTFLSPYIIHCVYECAVVLGRLDNEDAKDQALWLKELLGVFHRRWIVAGTYLGALNSERPSLIWFLSK